MPNTHPLFQQILGTLRELLGAAWGVCKSSRLLRIISLLAAVTVEGVVGAAIYVNFNRTNLPDLNAFIRFEPPTMGHIYDANGHVLIELGRERREIMQYKNIPDVLRQAILSAEDVNFFSHSGVDYSVFPRVLSKTNIQALIAWAGGSNGENAAERAPVFPQGGSTITQQLVRGFFLQKLTSAKNSNTLQHQGLLSRVLAFVIGVPGTNRVLLKVEEMRLSLWIEAEMLKRYGSKRRAKEELLARYASFIYLGNGRYGFAKAAQYYLGIPATALTADDADKAALLAGITKSPGEYAPTLEDNQRPLRRRNQILALMVKNHFLSAQTAQSSQQTPILLAAHVNGLIEAPAAVGNVLEELKRLDATPVSDIGINQLLEGHIQIYSTIDDRIQRFANAALENGLKFYERRHPQSTGLIQGSVVVLRNRDSAILAEAGGRRTYKGHNTTYSDYNRVTQSMRQPGSAMKPIVYLAAFRQGALALDTPVPDEPIAVVTSGMRTAKWISNSDHKFEGIIPARRALAESRNAVAIWIIQQIGIDSVLKTARDVGIRTGLQHYETTALGASEVTLLELANAYRMMASGIRAEPYVIAKIEHSGGNVIYSHQLPRGSINGSELELSMIQEGLRGVVRIPSGTAHALNARTFPIPVMGKTGTTSNYRDALFLGSTYGPDGITVAVRMGFDDNRSLGGMETGGRAALPVFREVMLKTYQAKLVGPVPSFPAAMENNIDAYLGGDHAGEEQALSLGSSDAMTATEDGTRGCRLTAKVLPTDPCEPPPGLVHSIYRHRDERGRIVFTNQ
ncbi:MAG TPA: transglycosylase domain-containing protein [Candidatus Dormibacteraeota bacterium]|nr:transglycosylase domain-containing protein [Candidatus Dormibacteraeota bacterium]